jgi:hypothetical protein
LPFDWLCPKSTLDREDLSRKGKGAKAQRKPFRNAAALCAFARKIFSEKIRFEQSPFDLKEVLNTWRGRIDGGKVSPSGHLPAALLVQRT